MLCLQSLFVCILPDYSLKIKFYLIFIWNYSLWWI
uniref:Uncharacterized protein n=1 Tax=Anguilla anguilla TaxID=7936 RepID=A0A0E9URZ0_ANGAN